MILISPTQLITTFSLVVLDACTEVTFKDFLSNEFDVELIYSYKLRYQVNRGGQALANANVIRMTHASLNT